MKKKIWLGVIGFIVLLAGGAIAYVSLIDWSEHKESIARRIRDVTGKVVVFDGPLNLRLFPSPYLTASNIKIYNQGDQNGKVPLAVIKNMVANLSLFPFIKGHFDVKKMSLIEPEVLFEIGEDRKLNWQELAGGAAGEGYSNTQIKLDSVTLEKATVRLLVPQNGIDVKVENLYADVSAESIAGPYTVDGNYVRGNSQEAFLIRFGPVSDRSATPMAFVLKYPLSDTTLQFEGGILLQNAALNGNLSFQSNRFAPFLKSALKYDLPAAYNYPLLVSSQINLSKLKLDLNQLAIRYGQSEGAGKLSVPLAESEANEGGRRKISVNFDMVKFDLNPAAYALQTLVQTYFPEKSEFFPALDFDIAADIRSPFETTYNGQIIKEFNLVFDEVDNEFRITNLTAVLPGESLFRLEGRVFSDKGTLSYQMKNELMTPDFQGLTNWLGYPMPVVNEAMYKKFNIASEIEGNLRMFRMPLKAVLDRTSVEGEFGAVLDGRKKFLFSGAIDNINFDNYVKPLPSEAADGTFAQRMTSRFQNLGFLNDFDLQVMSTLGFGIYEKIPFENATFNFATTPDGMQIETLDIPQVSGANIKLSGGLKGFGTAPVFENLNYDLQTEDIAALFNRLNLTLPDVDQRLFKRLNSSGTLNGTLDNLAIQANSKLDNIDSVVNGRLATSETGARVYQGELELKAPDFVKFVNFLNYNYSPAIASLGMLALKATVEGDFDKFKATDINANVGTNNFQGGILFDRTKDIVSLTANLSVNKFEIDRFMQKMGNPAETSVTEFKSAASRPDFLARPVFDKTKIDYESLNFLNMRSKFQIAQLSYPGTIVNDASFDFSISEGQAKIENLTGKYNSGQLSVPLLELIPGANPLLKGSVLLKNADISEDSFSGRKYGIKLGKYNADISFNTNANSFDSMFNSLNAKVDFDVRNAAFKGWNLPAIGTDLKDRDAGAGFEEVAQKNLQQGETMFDEISGTLNITNAAYVLEKSKVVLKDVDFIANLSGNLREWSLNSSFKTKFNETNLPALLFSLMGTLDSPSLAVDVTDIVDNYDKYWASVRAEKKAEADALKKRLDDGMTEQQTRANETTMRLNGAVFQEYEARKQKVYDSKVAERYEQIDGEIDEIRKELDEIRAHRQDANFDDDLLTTLANRNNVAAGRAEQVERNLNELYFQDGKVGINTLFNQVSGFVEDAKTKSLGSRDNYIANTKRLAAIETTINLAADGEISRLRDEITALAEEMNKLGDRAGKDYVTSQQITDLKELYIYLDKISAHHEKASEMSGRLNDKVTTLSEYLEKLVSGAEGDYRRKMEEERQRRIEEATRPVIKAVGKEAVVPEVEEVIPEAASDEAVEDAEAVEEEIRVLDFRDAAQEAAPEAVPAASGGVVKPRGVIRRK